MTSTKHSCSASYMTDEKYLPAYSTTHHHQRTATQSIRRGLYRVFGLKHANPRESHHDEFSAANDLPFDETAEILEDDNMAWGKPRKSRTKRERGRRDTNPDRSPHAPPPYVKFEAEMLDEDNMAWGKPTKRKTQHRPSNRSQPRPAQKRSSVSPDQSGWCC